MDVEALGVDYLTIVGHKFYGPRIGALFVRGLDAKETPLLPMLHGGGQERGYRSGCVEISAPGKICDISLLVQHREHWDGSRAGNSC